jgi:predicted RNA-binding Zn-ribbon protein involved in translation (DUF1610 family)
MADRWSEIEYGTEYEECPKCGEQGRFTGVFSRDNHEKFECPDCGTFWWELWEMEHIGRTFEGVDDYPDTPETFTLSKGLFNRLVQVVEDRIEDVSWEEIRTPDASRPMSRFWEEELESLKALREELLAIQEVRESRGQ